MKKIMIVDDEASVRISVRLVLESEGFEVSEAKDADECWWKLNEGIAPDLILLDVMMPGMNSLELLEKIGKDSKLKKIPVIYLSAVMGVKKATQGAKGVVGAIEKPFKNQELILKVKKALNK